jgi:photosystem II stability/assembly factor-like uncharacterized protein
MARTIGLHVRRGSLALLVGAAVLAGSFQGVSAAGAPGVWTPLAPGGSRVQVLAAAGGSPTVYAGTAYGGVFRTVDRGASWQAANSGLLGLDVAMLAVAPGGTTLYAGSERGLFRSDDSAATWHATGFPDVPTALALAPGAPATLYAADSGNVYRSDDGGGTWTVVHVLPYGLPTAALAVDAGSPQHVYYGTGSSDLGGLILVSRTGGKQWRQVTLPSVSNLLNLAADPAHPGTVYAATDDAVYVSRNGGGTWAPVPGLPLGTYTAVGFVAGAPGTVWAATDQARGRLWKSTDGGKTWTFTLAGSSLTAVIGDPLRPQRAYVATTPDGVLHGTFAAGAAPQLGTIAATATATLAVDAHGAGPIYANGLLAPQATSQAGIAVDLPATTLRVSADAGATWRAAGGLPKQGLVRLFADSAAAGGAFAVAGQQGPVIEGFFFAATPLLHSADAGATWQTLSTLSGYALDVAQVPSAPLTLYAAGYAAEPDIRPCPYSCAPYVATSADGGATWTYNSVPPFVFPFGYPGPAGWFVRIDPSDPQTIYVGETGALMKSTDGNQTWSLLDSAASFLDLAIDPQQPSRLYGVLQDGTTTVSADGGQTWQSPLGTGLPAGVNRIVAGPVPGTGGQAPPLYAATVQGVFASLDRGATWTPLGTGLPAGAALTVTVDATTGTVYAGVEGGGGLFALAPQPAS